MKNKGIFLENYWSFDGNILRCKQYHYIYHFNNFTALSRYCIYTTSHLRDVSLLMPSPFKFKNKHIREVNVLKQEFLTVYLVCVRRDWDLSRNCIVNPLDSRLEIRVNVASRFIVQLYYCRLPLTSIAILILNLN